MRPLYDGDVILYELGFSSQTVEDDVVVPRAWEWVQELLEHRLRIIGEEVGATEPPLFFFTNTPRINKLLNKKRKREDALPVAYVENFRHEVANSAPKEDVDSKEYKGGRKQQKPFHFYNLLSHILGNYECIVNESGLEADDALCIYQYTRWKQGLFDTVICSRDKDVRQCPGNHYSWEMGQQPAIGPHLVTELGELIKRPDERDKNGKLKPTKIFGTGNKFFYYQMLTGDSVDTVAGLQGKGPVFAYNLLKDATTVRECYELVAEKYVQAWEDRWKEKMRHMANLLWMVREINEKGEKVLWTPPPRLENVTSLLPQTPISGTKTSSNIVEGPSLTQS